MCCIPIRGQETGQMLIRDERNGSISAICQGKSRTLLISFTWSGLCSCMMITPLFPKLLIIPKVEFIPLNFLDSALLSSLFSCCPPCSVTQPQPHTVMSWSQLLVHFQYIQYNVLQVYYILLMIMLDIWVYWCLSFANWTVFSYMVGGSRLLCALHPSLPVLRVPYSVQHGGGSGIMWRLHIRGLLLLLLCRRPGRWLQLSLWYGLWHYGCLLRVLRLSGDLHGVLWHLLSHIKALFGSR